MFLQTPTPDTFGYMLAGFIVIFTLALLFLLSIWLRRRNLEKDLDVLDELEETQKTG